MTYVKYISKPTMTQAYRHDTAISTSVVGEAKLPGVKSAIDAVICKQTTPVIVSCL